MRQLRDGARWALLTIPLWWGLLALIWFARGGVKGRPYTGGTPLWELWPEGLFALGLAATSVHVLLASGLFFGRQHLPVGVSSGNAVLAWLPAVFFGPIIGWCFTRFPEVTASSWQWLYAARVLFSTALPILTSIPLWRAARGVHAPAIAFFLAVNTLMPAWGGLGALRDLLDGPRDGRLVHTGRSLVGADVPALIEAAEPTAR